MAAGKCEGSHCQSNAQGASDTYSRLLRTTHGILLPSWLVQCEWKHCRTEYRNPSREFHWGPGCRIVSELHQQRIGKIESRKDMKRRRQYFQHPLVAGGFPDLFDFTCAALIFREDEELA